MREPIVNNKIGNEVYQGNEVNIIGSNIDIVTPIRAMQIING